MWQWCRRTLTSREIWMGWRQWTESCVRSASLDTFGFLLVVDKTCPDVWSSLRPIQDMSLSIWCSEQPSGRCQWCLEWSRRSPWSWEKRNDFCKSLDIPKYSSGFKYSRFRFCLKIGNFAIYFSWFFLESLVTQSFQSKPGRAIRSFSYWLDCLWFMVNGDHVTRLMCPFVPELCRVSMP